MAGGSQEAGLGHVGALGCVLLVAQLRDQSEVLEPQADGLRDEARQVHREGCHERHVQQHQQARRNVHRVLLAQEQSRGKEQRRIEEDEERRHHGSRGVDAARADAHQAHDQEELVGKAVRHVQLDGADTPDEAGNGRADDRIHPPATAVLRRGVGTVEGAPLEEPCNGPDVHDRHPGQHLLCAGAGREHQAQQRTDHHHPDKRGRHVPELNPEHLRFGE